MKDEEFIKNPKISCETISRKVFFDFYSKWSESFINFEMDDVFPRVFCGEMISYEEIQVFKFLNDLILQERHLDPNLCYEMYEPFEFIVDEISRIPFILKFFKLDHQQFAMNWAIQYNLHKKTEFSCDDIDSKSERSYLQDLVDMGALSLCEACKYCVMKITPINNFEGARNADFCKDNKLNAGCTSFVQKEWELVL